MFLLGSGYAIGQGVQQNDAEAYRWFVKAAAQGDADAQTSLGVAYLRWWALSVIQPLASIGCDALRAKTMYRECYFWVPTTGVIPPKTIATRLSGMRRRPGWEMRAASSG
ncbi:SEL1-like repeat protein [Caballeronia sordidicola]|uniref:SEL1-like repeat protein n=1 Tax=Burkholderiaceae TaxID=119060 RepID=UPI00076B20D3|nr:hypothetical protein AXG89_22775 [Burkholderia sp. PAMC 26561]AME27452.1 hypothetical protein AXG89_26330 [Burkholderia sp. PAMC 26561]